MAFYWTVIVALVTACWAIISAIRDRKSQAIEHTRAIVDRLLQGDNLIIDNPDIQKYLSSTALESEDYFRTPQVLDDELFFKSKSFVYYQLNLFDEILSIAAQTRGNHYFFGPPAIIEIDDWQAYIEHSLSHPLRRSILNHEIVIFGHALQIFWATHKSSIESKSPDRFSW